MVSLWLIKWHLEFWLKTSRSRRLRIMCWEMRLNKSSEKKVMLKCIDCNNVPFALLSSNCSLNHSRLIGGDIYDLFESTFHTQVQVSNGNKLSITNPIKTQRVIRIESKTDSYSKDLLFLACVAFCVITFEPIMI